jgi:hypothetical protein
MLHVKRAFSRDVWRVGYDRYVVFFLGISCLSCVFFCVGGGWVSCLLRDFNPVELRYVWSN